MCPCLQGLLDRRRMIVALASLAAVSAVSGVLLLAPSISDAGPPDDMVIGNSVLGLRSLRDLVRDDDSFARLRKIAECLPLWRIVTLGGAAGATFEHRFEFAPPRRSMRRVLRAMVTTESEDDESFVVRRTREAYGTTPLGLPRPTVVDERQLDVVRLALLDADVFAQITALVSAGQALRDLNVVTSTSVGIQPTYPERDHVVGFHFGGFEGEPETESLYWRVTHDAEARSASFTRWTGDD